MRNNYNHLILRCISRLLKLLIKFESRIIHQVSNEIRMVTVAAPRDKRYDPQH